MNILIVGNEGNLNECQLKFGQLHSYKLVANQQEAVTRFANGSIVLDFLLHRMPEQIKAYAADASLILFADTTKKSLIDLAVYANHKMQCAFFGFCGLPSFLNRDILETSLYQNQNEEKLKKICADLNTKYSIVEDRVGLVTPRVICMIINEAYYTFQEETASREDIDLAMKLGTNYPYGPFEWAKRIGIKQVYEVLAAVYEDTKDERYKICPLLKREFLGECSDQQP
jgi:3-hydroxybutyryl-CoA dehydrogenase